MRKGAAGMTGIKGMLIRIPIAAFGAAAAYESLHVSSMGRVCADMGEPAGLAAVLSALAASLGRNGIADMLSRLGTGDFVLALALFAFICCLGELCLEGGKRAELRRKTLKAFPWALAAFSLIWVMLRLNNTSLFAWSVVMGGNKGYPLFGAARFIRRDEFAIWTPMALSQEALGWPGVNPLLGEGTDVTWASMGGLPAWNAALVFKPLYWGFLLLGSEWGFSLLTVGRLTLLFAVSFAAAMRYTRGNRGMSIAAGAMLTLAPMVQWFISQSIAEVLIFAQGMVLAADALLRSERRGTRLLWGALTGWLLGCFVMVGYPAWLIPAMYIVLGAWICLFMRRPVTRKGEKLGCMLLGMAPALILLGIVIYGSRDTLLAISGSAYPGSRLITGGLSDSTEITGALWNPAFRIDLASLFFPLGTMDMNASNYVDASVFLTFAPAGLVLSVSRQIREKKADPFDLTVTGILGLFWLFTFVRLPAWVCKMTLLSQCSRPVFPIQLCELILLIRSRAKGALRNPRLAAAAALLSTALNLGCIRHFNIVQPTLAQMLVMTAVYLLIFFLLYMDFRGSGRRLTAFFLCCVMLLAGGFVNPVQRGLDMIDDYELVSVLKSISDDSNTLYALEGGFPLSNVPLLAGKHCINSDQPYADMRRWAAVDPEGAHRDIYNRLCHVAVTLAEEGEGTEFREEGNYILLRLTRADLAALGVDYLITPRETLENATLAARDEADGLLVWKLE